MNGCQSYITTFAADAKKMQALLPAGYTTASLAGSPADAPILVVLMCDSIVIDNGTVVKNFQMEDFHGNVHVPADAQSPDPNRPNNYVYELIVNNQTVADAFARVGFHAALGTISAQVTAQLLQYQVRLGDVALYDFQGAGETAPGPPSIVDIQRLHQSDGVHHAWANESDYEVITSVGSIGSVTAHGGAVATVSENAMGATAAQTATSQLRVVLDFP